MSFSSATIVGVCGAGAMGVGIAQVAAQAGHAVIMLDMSEAALARGETALRASLSALVKRGRLGEAAAHDVAARLSWTTDVSALTSAGLVIEAIVEDEGIKTDLFDRIEAATAVDAVLATNTSSLSVTRLGARRKRPARFLGLHFFNPAPVMKLVEVIAGAETAPNLASQAETLMAAWGKTPVRVRDVPGFIVNRVARPYYAEGFRAWEEGIAEPPAIDALFRAAGFRMGPLELADMIGHDVNYAVACSVHAAYFGQTRFTPQLAQQRLVDAGRLGRKSGRGVYGSDEKARFRPQSSATTRIGQITLGPDVDGDLSNRLAELGATIGDVPVGCVDIDGVLIAPGDGRMAATRSVECGRPFAVLDWIAAEAEEVGYSASDDQAASVAEALCVTAGWRAVRLADRPGMIVLRTLAQLANAAADAVRDRVATAAGVDQALRSGANYPIGPIEWASDYGVERLVRVLTHIAEETGEAMYRPSEGLRRESLA